MVIITKDPLLTVVAYGLVAMTCTDVRFTHSSCQYAVVALSGNILLSRRGWEFYPGFSTAPLSFRSCAG